MRQNKDIGSRFLDRWIEQGQAKDLPIVRVGILYAQRWQGPPSQCCEFLSVVDLLIEFIFVSPLHQEFSHSKVGYELNS